MSNFKIFSFKKILFLSFLYIIIFMGYGYYTYKAQEKDTLKRIKQELLHGAVNVPLLLPKNYHDKDFIHNRPSKQEDLANIIKLSKSIEHTNLAYIYSFIQEKNGTILFSSSSATQKEIDANESDLYSFDTYEDTHLLSLFQNGTVGKPIYTDTADKWGHFLSVYVLEQTPHGRKYIVGADYKQQDLHGLKQTIIHNIIYFITFIFILIVFIYLLSNYSIMHFLKKELKKKTKQLKSAYERDKNTQLKNKAKLFFDIDKLAHSCCIAIVDIEKFSMINDVYGYNYGNKYLIYVASLLMQHTHKVQECKLYKLESDLFCIISTQNTSIDRFEQDIYKLIRSISKEKFKYQHYESGISLRAGIADLSRKDNPLMQAEIALKNAKEHRQHTMIYTSSMDINAKNKKVLDDINNAIEKQQVFAYFQPIYDLQTKTITKYESLIRIKTQEGKIVPPAHFLDLAKKTVLYKELTDIMIQKVVCAAQENPHLNFSLNLSSIDIENETLTNHLLNTITQANIGTQITFEILESEEFKNFTSLLNFINEAKKLGIKISIDDFGSGYSNIANTIKLEIDYLKIDGSLITNILTNPRYEKILKSIINFAHEIGALTIAEFVENEAIAQKMQELHVDMIQGYHIGKPSPVLCTTTKT